MEVFKDTRLVKLELLSNATTLNSALNYITQAQESQQNKHLALDATDNDSNENDGQPTTTLGIILKCKNGVIA